MSESKSLRAEDRFGGGRFALIRLLGRGGMGEVWLARDERLEEQVALKFLPPEVSGNPSALKLLRLEAARSHRLTHPNIVRLHDFFELPGEPVFISMEYVDGTSLNAFRMERMQPVLSWEFLRKPLADLCAALGYAHAENVIHRDIKPDNLLMDSRGRLKLTDFGLATMAGDLARPGVRAGGTLHYMSPQQVEGRHPEITDDIYAVGAALYELLTGQPPFREGDIAEQILHDAPEPLSQRLLALGIDNDIPADVAAMVMSCLAKNPEQRPQSALALAEWLRLSNAGAGVSGGPPDKETGEQLAGAVLPERGRRKVLWTAAGAVLLLALGIGWFLKTQSRHAAAGGEKLAETDRAGHAAWPADQRWTNSLGMVFGPVPETEVLFCIWKTRVQDYQLMVNASGRVWEKPSFEQGPTHPAVNIKWEDAKAFCRWLTQREREAGVINRSQYYRLPTDAEWSVAVGLGEERGNSPKEKDNAIKGIYPWGKAWPPPVGAGNFDQSLKVDDYPHTSPVGSFNSNAYGLYDLAGNAREWCEDLYTPGSPRRVVRGSSWFDTPAVTLQSSRRALTPAERHDNQYDYFGFRCILVARMVGAPE